MAARHSCATTAAKDTAPNAQKTAPAECHPAAIATQEQSPASGT